MNISDSELFAQIKAGNESAVEIVYKLHRAKFTSWALSKFKVSSQDAEDVWQDTIIVFFENVKNGKLLVLNSKFGTYLFAIGKYILLNKLKKNQKMEFPGSFEEENFGSNELQDFDFPRSRSKDLGLLYYYKKLYHHLCNKFQFVKSLFSNLKNKLRYIVFFRIYRIFQNLSINRKTS